MEVAIITLVVILTFILLVKRAYRIRDKSESRLSINEHPATFKKPDIEMVNRVSQNQNVGKNADITSEFEK